MPPLVFPQSSTAAALEFICAQALTLRLYSNSHQPVVTDTITSFVEVTGAGYAAIALAAVQWTITPGSPSVALYDAFQDFIFTDVPVPDTVYGYYVTNEDDLVVYAEQLFTSGAPFTAALGSRLQIRPRFGADNLIAPPVVIP